MAVGVTLVLLLPAFTLPVIALWFGGDDGWRYAIGLTGVLSLLFSFIYYANVSDTPKGSTYFPPEKPRRVRSDQQR